MFNPSPAKPRQFRQTRVLIVGCGDVGLRVRQALGAHVRVLALTSTPARLATLRSKCITPLQGNLDEPASLARLAGLAARVLHLAPPPSHGQTDPRTRQLLQALSRRTAPAQLVYASTTGVYGDAQGQWCDETHKLRPQTDRARRRAHAESVYRWWGRRRQGRVTLLRVPGIYAFDRAGGDPRERIHRGSPVLRAAEDVYTNHIHADDLARACVRALWRGLTQQAINVVDDQAIKMGDYCDQVADTFGLPRPARLSRVQAQAQVSAMQWSFMSESRRLHNQRMKDRLGLTLRYPGLQDAVAQRPS